MAMGPMKASTKSIHCCCNLKQCARRFVLASLNQKNRPHSCSWPLPLAKNWLRKRGHRMRVAHCQHSDHIAMNRLKTPSASQPGSTRDMKIHVETQDRSISTGTFALGLAVVSILLLISTPISIAMLSFFTLVASIYFCYWQSDHLEFLVLALLAVGTGWVQMSSEIVGADTDWASTALAAAGTLAALGLCYFNEMAQKKDL